MDTTLISKLQYRHILTASQLQIVQEQIEINKLYIL